MRRVFKTVLVSALLAAPLAGCGGGETVTREQLDAMSEDQILAMGECQLQKLYEAEGQEAVDQFTDEMVESIAGNAARGEIVPIQIELSEKGYNCPEYLPNG